MEEILRSLITAVVGGAIGGLLGALFAERRTPGLKTIGPTRGNVEGAWFFYVEFSPQSGAFKRYPTALANVGGSVEVRDNQGVVRYQADSVWAGNPTAGTATLFGVRGLLAFVLIPQSHIVMPLQAGTPPHADQLKIQPTPYSFDWTQCKDWTLTIRSSAPGAVAASYSRTIEQLVTAAKGLDHFPGISPIIKDQSLLTEGMLLKGDEPPVFQWSSSQRRHIPDVETFENLGFKWPDVRRCDQTLLDSLPRGNDTIYVPIHIL